MRIATITIMMLKNSAMGTMALIAIDGGLSKLDVMFPGGGMAGICASCSGVRPSSEDRSMSNWVGEYDAGSYLVTSGSVHGNQCGKEESVDRKQDK